jgi:hypothetical protein
LGNLKGSDHWKYLDVAGKIILEWILGKYGGKLWIHPAQDNDLWWAVVNTAMNI